MKSLLKTGIMLIAVLLLSTSCSNDDDSTPPGDRAYDANGAWNCEINESCQDVYEFDFSAGSRIAIAVEQVTGGSVVRIAIHGPGNGLGGINLLTGTQNDLQCEAQDENVNIANFTAVTEGIYTLAVTRDWGASAGFDGTYSLSVISDTLFEFKDQTVEDVDSLAPDGECN